MLLFVCPGAPEVRRAVLSRITPYVYQFVDDSDKQLWLASRPQRQQAYSLLVPNASLSGEDIDVLLTECGGLPGLLLCLDRVSERQYECASDLIAAVRGAKAS